MERILSQEEIAELLAAVQQGDIETEPEPSAQDGERKVKPFDLTKTAGSGRVPIPNVDILFDVFGRNYGVTLTNRLQRSAGIKLGGLESTEFESFTKSLAEGAAIGILRLDPFKSGGLIILDSSLSFSLIEMILGGRPEGRGGIPGRPMTTIEMHLIQGLLGGACGDLQKAFRPLENLSASLVKVENNPRLSNVVSPDTPVMVARYEVAIDKMVGEMSLVLPYVVIEPLRDKMRDGLLSLPSREGESWTNRIGSELFEVEAQVSVQLDEIVLKVRDILNFQEGDIIALDRGPDDPVQVQVEGKPKFQAMAGIYKGKKAVRIGRKLAQGANDGNH
ncbi:flagellar motor switch protein FliM [Desulfuromonas sp.]|uniref:flagellar motor switch protein FliM n=1 Tax=Desulfuromonas sp. TaxID=892 RepID=UPI0025B9F682|nr:flagellar motor switch protein FliM [Desulfuromonas sp.]